MSVSYFSKLIKNGKDMEDKCDVDNLDSNMKKIVKSIKLKAYKKSSSTHTPILMHSVPGCGKTYLVKTIIQIFQDEYDYLWIDISEIMSSLYGETQKKIHFIFEAARNHKRPVILFFDEIDGIFGEHKDSQPVDMQNITTFKQETDGNKNNSNIILICATNHFEKINDAIKSRFPNQYKFQLPNKEQRLKFFRKKFSCYANTLNDNDFDYLANQTNKHSFRELEKVFNDLSDISAELNHNSRYFVIGHGIDRDGNEKDGLYVAVPPRTEESFEAEKTVDFINNIAQVPINKKIIHFYFEYNRDSNNLPPLPYYSGPIFPKDYLKNQEEKKILCSKKKRILFHGSIALGCIIFNAFWLISKIIFKKNIQNNPKLNYVLPIISLLISIYATIKISEICNFDDDKLSPAGRCIRGVANVLGDIINYVIIPILNPIFETSSNIYSKLFEIVTWPIKKFIIMPIKKIVIEPIKKIGQFCSNVFNSIKNKLFRKVYV